MSCSGNSCACVGVNKLFDDKMAKKEYRKYLKKGPHGMTKRLLAALKKEDIKGMSLIDIGGGVGAIHHELLSFGIEKAADVDGSEAYIEKSKEEAKRLNHEDKLEYHLGDYVEHSDHIGEADIITLDKVICCYKDMNELVARSSKNAKTYYGVIYPNDRWWTQLFSRPGNIVVKLKSKEFKSYIHSEVEIDEMVRNNGFEKRYYYNNLLWQVILYAR